MSTIRVVEVVIDSKAGGADAEYSYLPMDGLSPGDAVMVPLGTRQSLGYVLEIREVEPEALGFPVKKLRKVQARVAGVSLPPQTLRLVRFVAQEYLCPVSVALSAAVPPGLRDRLVDAWILVEEPKEKVSAVKDEVLQLVREAGGTLVEGVSTELPGPLARALRVLTKDGILRREMRLAPLSEKKTTVSVLRLTRDEAKVSAFLAKEGKKRPAQALTLMRLQTGGDSLLTAAEIRALAGVTDRTIQALVSAGFLELVDPDAQEPPEPPVPNLAQQMAIDAILDAVTGQRSEPFLLFGVTGSGKTEVYLRAASEALAAGRQVLYLVPEIALATQAISQLRARFGRGVAVLHSELTPTERLRTWQAIRDGEVSVVLGPRSALFAPLANLGLIIMDEEHETSYKQDSSPRYHAKSLVLELGRAHGCPAVLGSATPSVESFAEADGEAATLGLLPLPYRTATAVLPEVRIRDLGEGFRNSRPDLLTEELAAEIALNLERGEQTILFLNRRAYSPSLICRDCGHRPMCPKCSVSLSFHRGERRLRCHMCGYETRPPETCPECEGTRVQPFGVGTERVLEHIQTTYPAARAARLDRDVAQRKGALEETLALFRAGDLDILVGTQMIAKGLDFPNVTLVGVIAADISLNIPDFRSTERTFQLLSQVAGRAGRGKKPGRVIIQTFNPDHPAIQLARQHDYVSFYEYARSEREEALYPPFARLVNVVISGEAEGRVQTVSAWVANRLGEFDIPCLGPVDCPLEKLQNRHRRHVIMKLPPGASLEPITQAIGRADFPDVQVTIDVDAYNLM